MSLLDLLSLEQAWETFYQYKLSLAVPKRFTSELRTFIDEKRYLPVCGGIARGEPFPLPKKTVISKTGTDKKRTVYTYPKDENTVLKLLTFLLLRKYDGVFSGNLYSFRPGRTAKDAVRKIVSTDGVYRMYAYKADIHDYFNSVPVGMLLPVLKKTLSDDEELFLFLEKLLTEPRVLDKGREAEERKGIMAGTPLSSFYANLFLAELDRIFYEKGALYARYSDDIIVFSRSEKECAERAALIKGFLSERNLEINPGKEEFFRPGDGIVFLGFSCSERGVDIAPVTLKKLKAKMRRKRDALSRWSKRSGTGGEKAAKAFVRIFNRKFFEDPDDNSLSWSKWFFPVISVTDSLREIDRYAQDCLRYLISGTHRKARFNVRYEDLKAVGYRNLVHAYYDYDKGT
ncbi:MAG: group II intron reverse transcriptase domain-containing protein [Clostridia bacterium]|nr:group II intron reverse transcriptase domain-containing protein [Clostridia bacterium]